MTVARWVLGSLAALVLAGAVALVGVGISEARRRRRWRGWAVRPAVVTSVGFEHQGERGVLRVVFDVEGRSSSELDIGAEAQPMAQRAELLRQFAVGSSHEARVDPSGRLPAVLHTGLGRPGAAFVVASIFALLALLLWVVGALLQWVATLGAR